MQLKHLILICIITASLFQVSYAQGKIDVLQNGQMRINAPNLIGSSDLTIRSVYNSGFGGMYIETTDDETGKPFYGYALNGSAKAYHYYDVDTESWRLYNGSERLTIEKNGQVGIGTLTPTSLLHISQNNAMSNGKDGNWLTIENRSANSGVLSGLKFKNASSDSTAGIVFRDGELHLGVSEADSFNTTQSTLQMGNQKTRFNYTVNQPFNPLISIPPSQDIYFDNAFTSQPLWFNTRLMFKNKLTQGPQITMWATNIAGPVSTSPQLYFLLSDGIPNIFDSGDDIVQSITTQGVGIFGLKSDGLPPLVVGNRDASQTLSFDYASIESDSTLAIQGTNNKDITMVKGGGRVGIGSSPTDAKLSINAIDLPNGANALEIITDIDIPFLPDPVNHMSLTGSSINANTSPLFLQTTPGNNIYLAGSDNNLAIGSDEPAVKCHIQNGTFVSSSETTGFLMLGDDEDVHLVFDNNEIMAKNDNATSDLFIQDDGGRIGVGLNGTSLNSTFHLMHPLAPPGTGYQTGLKIENAGSNGHWWNLYTGNGGDGDLFIYSETNGTTSVGSFDATTGAYSSNSDIRLKTNIEDASSMMDRILTLKLKKYHFKIDPNATHKQFGFIAQDLQTVFPEFVTYDKGQDIYKVNYAGLSTIAIKAVQEQQLEIDAVKLENEQLKNRLDRIEKLLDKMME